MCRFLTFRLAPFTSRLNWQSNCIGDGTMKNITFNDIKDAYQLVQGAKIKGKTEEELFELGEYDANKRGYVVYPFEGGMIYTDFKMIITEKELMTNYMIEPVITSPFQRAA
jgi:N-acyl-L-homoserine lactone synthetase